MPDRRHVEHCSRVRCAYPGYFVDRLVDELARGKAMEKILRGTPPPA